MVLVHAAVDGPTEVLTVVDGIRPSGVSCTKGEGIKEGYNRRPRHKNGGMCDDAMPQEHTAVSLIGADGASGTLVNHGAQRRKLDSER